MSSLDPWSTRVNWLSVAISDLETKRSEARRELNTLHDPMARLPLEISSEIFMQYLAGSALTPKVFLRVCHLWRHIALSTPSLWTVLHADSLWHPGSGQRVEAWLARARSLPLFISLNGHVSTEVSAVLEQHAPQVQTLLLGIESPEQLDTTITMSFLTLQKLYIENWAGCGNSYLGACLETMRRVPTLTSCEFIAMRELHAEEARDSRRHLIHSTLRQLRLGKPHNGHERMSWRLPTSSRLLPFLTLPSLEDLLISQFDIPNTEFLSFLRRSSPPLQTLHMTVCPTALEYDWVPLVPSLASLTLISDCHTVAPIPVLDQMARDRDILPNLVDLSITCWPTTHEDYEDLMTVLISRGASHRTQLRSFQLIFPFDDTYFGAPCRRPNGRVIEVLRELAVKEGIHIHIGPQSENYVWSGPSMDDSDSSVLQWVSLM
ncbi:hypothetical protein C8R46DRAFT_366441 [Mycena filopes]|nr:hypothetical protein C8R46DRAFT_366441 [Mycena filopes]